MTLPRLPILQDLPNLRDGDGGRIRKRSLRIAGHETSITLEDEFWDAFRRIAKRHQTSVNKLATEIDKQRQGGLSGAIRVFVLREASRQEQS